VGSMLEISCVDPGATAQVRPSVCVQLVCGCLCCCFYRVCFKWGVLRLRVNQSVGVSVVCVRECGCVFIRYLSHSMCVLLLTFRFSLTLSSLIVPGIPATTHLLLSSPSLPSHQSHTHAHAHTHTHTHTHTPSLSLSVRCVSSFSLQTSSSIRRLDMYACDFCLRGVYCFVVTLCFNPFDPADM
jgi:hypothetical protein